MALKRSLGNITLDLAEVVFDGERGAIDVVFGKMQNHLLKSVFLSCLWEAQKQKWLNLHEIAEEQPALGVNQRL